MSIGWCLKLAGVVAVAGFLTTADARSQQSDIAGSGITKSPSLGIGDSSRFRPGPLDQLLLPNVNQLTPLDKAYLDAFTLLKEDNPCSAFYGGPPAIQVLNQLKRQLKSAYFDGAVAARMTGQTGTWTSVQYQLLYRLFDKAELNLEGPFYRGKSSKSIGTFLPNTREARVTILLHELGHLIQGQDKQWLLPNDGASEDLSQQNTERVIAVCGKEIGQLRGITFSEEIQEGQSAFADDCYRGQHVTESFGRFRAPVRGTGDLCANPPAADRRARK
ncbi:MAG TPA: hypothetical protein VMS31_11175 [Pyrinomonadaceae bacterium]|nr:hypothetical protein [Pyrinomonadaceae bacterium]